MSRRERRLRVDNVGEGLRDLVDSILVNFLRMRARLELRDAFVYRWRLWSVPELRDAMMEAGFRSTEVYDRVPEAADGEGRVYLSPVRGADLEASFIVCVAGRRDAPMGGGD